jgi:hypothetical protein
LTADHTVIQINLHTYKYREKEGGDLITLCALERDGPIWRGEREEREEMTMG